MNLLKLIFLTKKQKEYLKNYQINYHKFSSLKERNYVLKSFIEYENSHINWTNDQKEKEVNNIIYNYFNVKNNEELYMLLKDEDNFISSYKERYGNISEDKETTIRLEYLKYKNISKEKALKIISEKVNEFI